MSIIPVLLAVCLSLSKGVSASVFFEVCFCLSLCSLELCLVYLVLSLCTLFISENAFLKNSLIPILNISF